VTVPDVGQVTESVAISPTEAENGWYCETKHTAVQAGLVAEVAVLVGLITTVAYEPAVNSGARIASTEPAPKSWKKFRVTDPDFKPATRVLNPPPKAVVSISSAERSRLTLWRTLENAVPLTVILWSVAT
jgi:hypothetical protein